MINRRQWLYGMGMLAGGAARSGNVLPPGTGDGQKQQPRPLELSQFVPTSMLEVHASRVERSRFPVIDFHSHITTSAKSESGVALSADRKFLGSAEELLAVMDRKNIRAMVNLTGGYDQGLTETVRRYDRAYRDRFYTFAEPSYSLFLRPDYPKLQAEAIGQAHRDGARGLKIVKTLGLYLRSNITS